MSTWVSDGMYIYRLTPPVLLIYYFPYLPIIGAVFPSGRPRHPLTATLQHRSLNSLVTIAPGSLRRSLESLSIVKTTSGNPPFSNAALIGFAPTSPPYTPPTCHHCNMPIRKPRCNFKECRELAQRIVGDCSFCSGHYCSKHRMLEAHACTGLEDCKKESHARNADKLNSERTQVIKGV
ncbi:hypothetical protein BBP40_000044 [Aspergillus hancockii]|nr:hypothetical protein BBP40_000044 [Aspergillus hancockii]